jgi:hypothetical protein
MAQERGREEEERRREGVVDRQVRQELRDPPAFAEHPSQHGGEQERTAAAENRRARRPRQWRARVCGAGSAEQGVGAGSCSSWSPVVSPLLGAVMAAMGERLTGQIAALGEQWDFRGEAMRHELIGAVDRRIADAVALQRRTLSSRSWSRWSSSLRSPSGCVVP